MPQENLEQNFFDNVLKDFRDNCVNKGLPETSDNLLTYLIVRNFFSRKKIRDFVLLKEHADQLNQPNNYKTQTELILHIANKFKLNEATVRHIIRNYYL